jgi:peptidyl-prolyl cis-trans isomerase B (cyclophilin B)
MKKFVSVLLTMGAFLSASAEVVEAENPRVVLDTSEGKIVLELYMEKAHDTVQNFLGYIDAKFFDGTIFHRVIPNFMIQGGGFTADMKKKSSRAPIRNEADNGLDNDRYTIAMARTSDPHSATAQFFINTAKNDFLNFKNKTDQGWGYAVFGKVVEGMDTVDVISAVKTTTRGPYGDVPVKPVVIKSAGRVK